jgi:hypothetical protein
MKKLTALKLMTLCAFGNLVCTLFILFIFAGVLLRLNMIDAPFLILLMICSGGTYFISIYYYLKYFNYRKDELEEKGLI